MLLLLEERVGVGVGVWGEVWIAWCGCGVPAIGWCHFSSQLFPPFLTPYLPAISHHNSSPFLTTNLPAISSPGNLWE